MSHFADPLCNQYFGHRVYEGFRSTVDNLLYNSKISDNRYKRRIPISGDFLTNHQILNRLILSNYSTLINEIGSSYIQTNVFIELFMSNINQFIDPIKNQTIVKYFGCTFAKWKKNIEKLLMLFIVNQCQTASGDDDIKNDMIQLISSFTMNENALYNYEGLIVLYFSTRGNQQHELLSDQTQLITEKMFQCLVENEKYFTKLPLSSSTPYLTVQDDQNSTVDNSGTNNQSSLLTISQELEMLRNAELEMLLERNAELITLRIEQKRTIQNQREMIRKLQQQVLELKEMKEGSIHQSLDNDSNEKFIEIARKSVLEKFNMNEVLKRLNSLILDDSVRELLVIIMKLSMCHAFSECTAGDDSLVVIRSAKQYLISLLIKNNLKSKLTSDTVLVVLFEQFHKLVKEVFENIHSIPTKEIRFDFSNDLKDKRIEKFNEKDALILSDDDSKDESGSNEEIDNNNSTTTTPNYYCILPSMYCGEYLCEQGVLMIQQQTTSSDILQ